MWQLIVALIKALGWASEKAEEVAERSRESAERKREHEAKNPKPVRVTLSERFDAAEARLIARKGTASVRGQAFMRRRDGGVVTAAGSAVLLFPRTDYTDERMEKIFGIGGKETGPYEVIVTNEDPQFFQFCLKTVADAEGRFRFSELPPGDYYLHTTVLWRAFDYPQGGRLLERISLDEGEVLDDLILSGN